MPRRTNIKIRKVLPDPLYQSELVAKLINCVMISGKKTIAQKHVYKAMEEAAKQLKSEPLIVLEDAIERIKPRVEVRARRVGGAAYQVPNMVSPSRSFSLAIKWLINASRARPSSQFHTFADKLAAELVDSYNGQGGALAKKQEVEKIAESNKAFAHLRW